MELVRINVFNFLGVTGGTTIDLKTLTVLIGKNDVGKSTILKALNLFFNESAPEEEHLNLSADVRIVEISCEFKPNKEAIVVDETHPTTFENEGLLASNGNVIIVKKWDFSGSRLNTSIQIAGYQFADELDLVLLTQPDLIKKCKALDISTKSASGVEYNNAEKRQKIREAFLQKSIAKESGWIQLSASGTGRPKKVYDGIKAALPRFEYFRADSSLSESETATQNYLRRVVNVAIQGSEDSCKEIEAAVTHNLNRVLANLTEKMNRSLPEESQVKPNVMFDWTKLVKVGFETANDDGFIPLAQRGDGFRRVTMMSFFEHLAEQESSTSQPIIFGFEEPETFLHPSAQEKLFDSLTSLTDSGYQVVMSTHSPILVSCSPKDSLIHISRTDGQYKVDQVTEYESIADDLGISIKNQFISTFDPSKVLFLVEGPDDVKALRHICKLYKENRIVTHDFEEIGIQLFPIGGKDSIKHLVTLKILKQLSKPFLVWLDSDKESDNQVSRTYQELVGLGLRADVDFVLTQKRAMENYMPPAFLNGIVPSANLNYTDYCCVKTICKSHPEHHRLKGKKVLDNYFERLGFSDLQTSFQHSTKGDEFIFAYNRLKELIPQRA